MSSLLLLVSEPVCHVVPTVTFMEQHHEYNDHRLSATDCTIADLVARGMTNKEIAGQLNLSHQTVRNHVSRIFDEVGVSNRTQLALAWLKRAG